VRYDTIAVDVVTVAVGPVTVTTGRLFEVLTAFAVPATDIAPARTTAAVAAITHFFARLIETPHFRWTHRRGI